MASQHARALEEAGPVLAHDGDECCGEDEVHGHRDPEDRRVHPLDINGDQSTLKHSSYSVEHSAVAAHARWSG